VHPILSFNSVSIGFVQQKKAHNVVHNSSFVVHSNSVTAIVGESGSGKSVTCMAITQLLGSNVNITGQITYHHNQKQSILNQLPYNALQHFRGKEIAYIFQEPMTALNPLLTCGQQLQETIVLHQNCKASAAKQTSIALFNQVRLPNPQQVFNKYPHQLSGGQKQRVMIAMALSCNPKILIADEPTTALDVTVQKSILQLLKEIQIKTKLAIVFITHDLGIVADFADHVIVMQKGNIVEQGPAKDVLTNPQNSYTKALLATRPSNNTKGFLLPTVNSIISGNNTTQPIPNTIATTTPVLTVQNLTVQYTTKIGWRKPPQITTAVNNVSFTVNRGSILGLVGESGCGKTTLSRTILGLITPTSGQIILNGQSINSNKPLTLAQRKNVQIVFQDPYSSLNPRLKIGPAIVEALQVHFKNLTSQQCQQTAEHWLQQVQLTPDAFNKYPHQFSGGQRQRICIARALALQPAFIIFDESVSALDVSVQAEILNLLQTLRIAHQFTAIFISHDLSVVHYLADNIMVMQNGVIVEQGTATQIYNAPAHPYTQQLIAAMPGKMLIASKV
jgi:peptide/nickel transport system ATP-binding protein